MSVDLFNMDCMEYMAGLEDNAFELAIVDPPYGIGGNKNSEKHYKKTTWDDSIPTPDYFLELARVSKNRIIWGANFYPNMGAGRIVWNKLGKDIGRRKQADTISDCEIAYHSFGIRIKMFSYTQIGNVEGNSYQIDWNRSRIHPCQKPVALYEWLLSNYAKEGDRILDTHLGSGSSAIAAHYAGFDFVGCELDPDYYNAAKARFDDETKQVAMF
jgi:site-specific DNA-methyltransferase (adenine-specific)